MEPKKGKVVLRWALTVGIIVVLNLFFAAALDLAAPNPNWEDFCSPRQINTPLVDEASCRAVGGQWNPVIPGSPKEATPYCNEFFTCQMEYEDARVAHEQTVFTALVVLGALSLIAGVFTHFSPAVSAGLSYGGVLTFIIAAARYWEAAGDFVRLAIVGVALIALITVGVRYFKE